MQQHRALGRHLWRRLTLVAAATMLFCVGVPAALASAHDDGGKGNVDRAAQLTVVVHVVDDDGGKAQASSFRVSVEAASATPASFAGAEAPGTDVELAAGAYAVIAEPVLGYQTTLARECRGTLALGEATTCVVTGDDLAPLAVRLRAGTTSVSGGSSVDYELTLTNRNEQGVVARDLTVALPDGFAYRAGSAAGGDPRVDGQQLTWIGPFDVGAGGTATIRFAATAPTAAGTYPATAAASADAPFTVVGDSAGAVVTVQPSQSAPSPPPPPPAPPPPTTTTTTTTTAPTGPPPPVFQTSADVAPVDGNVLLRLPGSTDFVPLTAASQVPIGTELDTTDGRVELSTVDGAGTLFHAVFSEGRFKVEKQLANGVMRLRLTGGNFGACKAATRTFASVDKKRKPKRPARARSQKSIRHLWGTGKGRFQTRGRYLAATVHGTTWFTEDRCDASRAYVQEGVVAVRDLVKRKTVEVTAGQSYFARPRR